MSSSSDIFGKSAKMWVHEICVKQLVQAKWDCKEIEPRVVPPKFVCSCTIEYTDKKLVAEAFGKTKKEAQQEAALLMLYQRLEMTPAKLDGLNRAALKTKKSNGVADTSFQNGNDENEQIDPVSDTDDREMAENNVEPVQELFALCNANDFVEPAYAEVKQEGPPHKRIFTMSCSVSIPDKVVSIAARRLKKQAAKKMSAYRVLRELNTMGYEYVAFKPDDKSDSSTEQDGNKNKKFDATLREIAKHFNNMSMVNDSNDKPFSKREILLKYTGQLFCSADSGSCTSRVVDYPHAFKHLKLSETMTQTLMKPDLTESTNEHGGPIALLQKIVSEMKISTSFIPPEQPLGPDETCCFLRLEFPFIFKYNIPKSAVVNGVGATEILAKEDAAMEGLKLLRNFFFDEKEIILQEDSE
ncbi:unnamed protein product [Orchesella dallaii]|uniref:DRBM domain-containing protein n=1 Tax=Orchesella dallaii TaxID=48710 RepID=A0ABP1S5K2_9HEXA